jgi:catechol 2,3-dioxygenase-like lactoylglutathione lyase family enzyme
MIDHIYLPVSDLNRSSEFYKKVLEPLGIDMPYKFDQPPIRGFSINNIPGFWLKMAKSPQTFTSHSPPRARPLSEPATRQR